MSVRDEAIEEALRNEGYEFEEGSAAWDDAVANFSREVAAYEAAMLERGWKMTPRDATVVMSHAVTGGQPSTFVPSIEWQTMWNKAPNPTSV